MSLNPTVTATRVVKLFFSLLVLVSTACTPKEGPPVAKPPSAGEPRPNVLFIVTDDQFQGTLAAMPRTRFWFEEHGTRYTNAVVTTPLCCPSRASILTGRYVHNHGVLRNNFGPRLDQRSTLEKYLQDAGYLTAIGGKFLQGFPGTVDPRFWDEWTTSLWGYYNANFNVDGDFGPINRYSVDFLRNRGQAFLHRSEKKDDRPWLLYLAPVAPHKPYVPANRYLDAEIPRLRLTPAFTEKNRSDKPYFVRHSHYSIREGEQLRSRMIRTLLSVDDMVDAVMHTLGKLGERDRTLAFFLSDNGHLLGQHGLFAKRLPYRAAIEIPLLMRWPGHVVQGQTNDRLVNTTDLLPTVLEAAGITPRRRYPLDGRSLLHASERPFTLIEQFGNDVKGLPNWSSLRSDSYQYTEYRRAGKIVFSEYYDMTEDPWQLDNLLGDRSDANDPDVERLHDELEETRSCEGNSCP